MREKKGIILVAALIVMTVLLSMGAGYFSYMVYEKKSSDRHLAVVKAFYITEAGLYKSLVNLRNHSSGNISESFGSGNYTVSVVSIGSGGVYRLESTGEAKNNQQNVLATRKLDIYIRDTAFSNYSYFTNSEYFTQCWGWWCWQTPVWFTTGDRLEGPVFTNSEFHIAGDPSFYGQVRSTSNNIVYMNGGPPNDNPYFDPSYNPNPSLGVSSISMPSFDSPNLQDLKDEGLQFQGDTTIVFKNDGTMDVTNQARGWVNHNMVLPANNGMYVDGGDLYVSGILDGEVTAAAGTDISGDKGNVVIVDNLRFKDRYDGGSLRTDPLLPSESSDYAGLIAEKDIIVGKDTPDNLEIDASMMALGDSFIVERWWDANYNKGTLMILGGIIQDERGPVGTFSGSQKVSGYSKNYIYDERLTGKNLSYVPMTGEYKVISWRKE